MAKVQVKLKETVVRWKYVEIETDIPVEDLKGEALEAEARQTLFDEIQEDGYDGEEVLEQSHEVMED